MIGLHTFWHCPIPQGDFLATLTATQQKDLVRPNSRVGLTNLLSQSKLCSIFRYYISTILCSFITKKTNLAIRPFCMFLFVCSFIVDRIDCRALTLAQVWPWLVIHLYRLSHVQHSTFLISFLFPAQ